MSAQNEIMPTDPDKIEALIEKRRAHLASTIDQLTERTKPQAIADRAMASARAKLDEAFRTPDGQLRTEKVAAVGGAAAALLALLAANRRRRRRRKG